MQIGAQAAFLFRVARRAVEHAALAVVAVDAFLLQHPRDFVGNPVQQVVAGPAPLRRQAGEQAVLAEQVAHQPAAVAPRGAEAGGFCLDDGDAQLRRPALQVIGGPEAGVAGADDGHVDLEGFFQGRARFERIVQLIHPQAEVAPGRHRGLHSEREGECGEGRKMPCACRARGPLGNLSGATTGASGIRAETGRCAGGSSGRRPTAN